jgi:hypothetical protein
METAMGVFLGLGVGALAAIPYWRICSRTGLSKWTVLVLFIPILGLLVPWIIAFSDWPAVKPMRAAGPPTQDVPRKGVVYTQSEIDEFRRRGLM